MLSYQSYRPVCMLKCFTLLPCLVILCMPVAPASARVRSVPGSSQVPHTRGSTSAAGTARTANLKTDKDPGVAAIMLNQLGFYPSSPKKAVVTGKGQQPGFYLLSVLKKDTLFTGKLGKPVQSLNSGLTTRIADFSSFHQPGKYILFVPGIKPSPAFMIGDSVYHDVAVAALKGFYYQRASISLLPAFAGKWARAAGHPDTAVLIHASAVSPGRVTGTLISSSRGWYDAGDYNKYIVNSGISTSTLLSAFEDYPAYFSKLQTNIPESGNQVPDILNEAIYNMRWMLTMQDPADGGVYHKCTNARFDGMIMPDKAVAPRYAVQKGTAAALDFAAVMAQGARILKGYSQQLPGLSDSCLKASVRAWSWAVKHPDIAYDQKLLNTRFQPAILTGDYGDGSFKDEFFWAASELYATTTTPEYFAALVKGLNNPVTVPSWSNVQLLGYYALLHKKLFLPANSQPVTTILRQRILSLADKQISQVSANAFQTVIGQTRADFIWGSNAVAANQSIVLLYAYGLSGRNKYLVNSLTNLDYLLGQNATGYCFVTGFGAHSPMHPHHRQSVADGITAPVPGLLVAGPNPGMQDGNIYPSSEPETAYFDNDTAYACNEIAINWNAPLVYLLNAAEALQTSLNQPAQR